VIVVKTTNATILLLAVLVLAGMIISPVAAASYTLTGYQEFNVLDVQKDEYTNVQSVTFDKSEEDKAITLIHFKVPQDHQVDFTIYYGTGATVTGSASNVWDVSIFPATTTTSSITFDGVTKSYSYFDTNPSWDYYLSGYARNNEDNTTGLIVYSAGYGSFDNDLAVFKAVPNLGTNLIYRVDLSSDTTFDVDISYGSKSQVAATVSKDIIGVAGDWISFALSIAGSVLALVLAVFGLIKFFFIDNILLVIALWIGVTMAYSATSSKDIFGFYKKFFKLQRTLLDFIVGLWNTLVQIIAAFRGIFRI
jgi:hypothetical protein